MPSQLIISTFAEAKAHKINAARSSCADLIAIMALFLVLAVVIYRALFI